MPIVQFDLDGTLTLPYEAQPSNRIGTYAAAQPNPATRTICNEAYARGWTVTICTGRGEIYRAATEAWLRQHDVHYHFLFMGKLSYDVVIDDLARTPAEFAEILEGKRKLPLDEIGEIDTTQYDELAAALRRHWKRYSEKAKVGGAG